jgi:decaprenylphospho-beta-D-ribofuranose 2-oxidase
VLSGWGGTGRRRVRLERPAVAEDVHEALSVPQQGGLIARGAGRSYGDAAQNAGGVVLDMTALRAEPELDVAAGELDVAAGTTFAELLLWLARTGLTLPVVPGTRHLTVGGAIAADIHGKNHRASGSFGTNLRSFTLCTPATGPVEVSREQEPELFAATVGGMGLTGVITRARVRVVPMASAMSIADVDRVDSLEDAVALMSEPTPHSHSIAWLDLLGDGSSFGRAIVTRSSEASEADDGPGLESGGGLVPGTVRLLSRQRGDGSRGAPPFPEHPALAVPRGFPAGVLRPATVRAFNTLHWRSTPASERGRMLSMSAQLFPLDVLGDWNRLYGPGGLVQYQFVVPAGAEALLLGIPALLRRRRLPMYLAVLKRFGAHSEGMLSFPQEGWTIAIDLPAEAPGLADGLREADEMVVSGGGRIYLAKDARMTPETMRDMYPALPRFRDVCARVDPEGRLSSDMARRLELRS